LDELMPVSQVPSVGWIVVPSSPPPSSSDWNVAPLGAGGWITGLDVHADGTMVARPDTYGCYKFDRATETWTQMVSATSLPAKYRLPYSIFGGHEICIAPSNSSIMYLSWGSSGFPTGAVLKSVNGGTTWTETALNGIILDSNTDQRHYSPKMAVDPVNPNVVWFGVPGGGVYYTDNGGDTWTQQTQIAASVHEYGFVFDAQSSVVGGKTTKIYIASYGTGVYRSTDAGANFTLTSGTPTTFIGMTCSNNGSTSVDSSVLLVNGTPNLYRWSGGAWNSVAGQNAGSYWDVAVNPLNTNQVLVVQDSGRFSQSADNGVTFIDQGGGNDVLFLNTILSGDTIPWHGLSNENSYMSHGGLRFDPLESHGPGTVFIGMGIGVMWTNFLTTDPLYKTVQWRSVSVGIEQLVMQDLVKVPGGGLLTVQLDRGSTYLNAELDTYPSYTAPSMSIGTVNGFGASVCKDGKMWILYDEGVYHTTDHLPGNVIQSTAATFAGAIYGCIAANPYNSDNVVVQMASAAPYYTTNGGVTWTAGTGAPAGSGVPPFAKTHWLRAAGLTPGIFYMYGIAEGIYRSINGGATWTLSYARDTDEGDGFPIYQAFNNLYNVELACPDGSDDLWMSSGHNGSFPDSLTPSVTDSSLIRFTGAGTAATRITNAAEPYRICFGRPAPGKTYGTLFMVGWVNRGSGWEYGTWRCDDPDAGATLTWVDIGQWPNDSIDQVTTMAGDPDVFGRVYIGFNGSSVVWRDTAGL
jgi:hypothetical protein